MTIGLELDFLLTKKWEPTIFIIAQNRDQKLEFLQLIRLAKLTRKIQSKNDFKNL